MTSPTAKITETQAGTICPTCQGNRTAERCPRCQGTQRRRLGITVGGQSAAFDTGEPCPECASGAAACYACGGTGRRINVPPHGQYTVSVRPFAGAGHGQTFAELRAASETDGAVSRMEPWQRTICTVAYANPDVKIELVGWRLGRVGEHAFHVFYRFHRAGERGDCVWVSLNRGGDEWEWFSQPPFTQRVLYQRD